MRAREPDREGEIERDGVRIGYDVYGEDGDDRTCIVLFTSWAIVHMRQWKLQIPFLARHFRVLTVEGRGNGRADRPGAEEAYGDVEYVDDALAVMDATGIDRAVLVGLSVGARHALQFAARHPDRSLGVVAIGTSFPAVSPEGFDLPRESYEGWEKYNRHYWLADYPAWVQFFMSQVFTEPHSTKQREDGVSWGLDTDGRTLALTHNARARPTAEEAEATCRQIRCPVLVVHGDEDAVFPYRFAVALADWTGGRLITVHGGGHAPPMREPVLTNRLIRDFAETCAPVAGRPRTWTRARVRPRRALFVSSPIGLGHVLRDLAIADELRSLHPDLQIDWLAQDPVTRVLEEHGERVHPASRFLAGESAHIESEAGEHDLHVFQAVRRMDEILVANFMVFADLVDDEPYDLWIADEGWDVDAFLHDNPELKRTAYAWLTDFTGWLPMADGGAAEAALTADWNAERVERGRRYPRLRDRSIFVGNEADLVDLPLGPGLPSVREWGRQRYDFPGYVLGSPPPVDRGQVRTELGYRPRRAGLPGDGGRLRGGRLPAPSHRRGVPVRGEAGAGTAHGAGDRAADRPGVGPGDHRSGGPRLPARPPAPPGRGRHRRRAGRPVHDDGGDGRRPAVRLRAAGPPLRAADPRAPPAGAVRGGTADGLRGGHRPGAVRRGDRRRDRPVGGLPAGGDRRGGADRTAAGGAAVRP